MFWLPQGTATKQFPIPQLTAASWESPAKRHAVWCWLLQVGAAIGLNIWTFQKVRIGYWPIWKLTRKLKKKIETRDPSASLDEAVDPNLGPQAGTPFRTIPGHGLFCGHGNNSSRTEGEFIAWFVAESIAERDLRQIFSVQSFQLDMQLDMDHSWIHQNTHEHENKPCVRGPPWPIPISQTI